MVDYHYIKRGNKTYGPYYYRSYRVGNKVMKEYLGKDYSKKIHSAERKTSFLPLFFLLVILSGIFFIITFYAGITGKASVNLGDTVFLANQPIAGNLNIMLKQGELLPEKTEVIIQIENESYKKTKEIELNQLVRSSGIGVQSTGGRFYIEDTELAGEGSGYGIEGIKTINPFIYFTLQAIAIEETGTELFEQIDGSVVLGQSFAYETRNESALSNVNAEILKNSAYYYDETGKKENLDENVFSIGITSNKIEVTTSYSYQTAGFGQDFLNENTTTLVLNLSSLGLKVEEPGKYNLTINLSYENKAILQLSASIDIKPSNLTANYAPSLLQNIPNQTMHANANLSINLADYFADDYSDNLNYTSTETDNLQIIMTENIAAIIPLENWVGSEIVKFNASDGESENESNAVEIRVTNTPPALMRDIPALNITRNRNETLNLSWYFEDADNDLLAYSSSNPENITVNIVGDITILAPDFNFVGTRSMAFFASDAINKTESNPVSIEVAVSVVNHAPALTSTIPNQAIYKNEQAEISLAGYFSDADNDNLTYNISYAEADNLQVSLDSETGIVGIKPETNFTGNRSITFSATDGVVVTESNLIAIFVIEHAETPVPLTNITNATNITQPTANITNITEAILPGQILNETIVQHKAVIGQPVKWTRSIILDNPGNASVILPSLAENITVNKIERGNIQTAQITGAFISTLKRIQGRVTGHAVENEMNEIEWGATFIEANTNVIKITNESGEEQTILQVIDNADEYQISYETPAPYSTEQEISSGKKQITVSSDVHYENILAFTSLPEIVPAEKKYEISLYLLVNGTKQSVSFDAYDSNSNGMIDGIEWTVPSLSNQTYETSISIINVQSYPSLYGNWVVYFSTLGNADLKITATNGTTWNINEKCGNETCQLQFLSLACGSTELNAEWWQNSEDGSQNSVFYANYSCSEQGSETSKVLRAAPHALKFEFGSDVAYAYNDVPGDWHNETVTFLLDMAPIVNLTHPQDNDVITTSSALFTFNITETFGILNCSLYHNITSWGIAETNTTITPSNGTNLNNSFTITDLADDTSFSWNVKCYDTRGTGTWGESNRTVLINFWYTENVSFKIDRPPEINWTIPAEFNTSIFNLTGGFAQSINVTDYSLKEMNCTIYSDANLTKSMWSVSINITGNTSYVKTTHVNTSNWKAGTYYERCTVTDIPF